MVKKRPQQKGEKGLNSGGRPREKFIQEFLEVESSKTACIK